MEVRIDARLCSAALTRYSEDRKEKGEVKEKDSPLHTLNVLPTDFVVQHVSDGIRRDLFSS